MKMESSFLIAYVAVSIVNIAFLDLILIFWPLSPKALVAFLISQKIQFVNNKQKNVKLF